MEKIWIKKELHILIYEFLKFYALFLNLIWFLYLILEVFSIKNREKRGYYLQADMASGPTWWMTWLAGPPRGATRHWGHVAEPGGPARAWEAHLAQPRGRRPRDHMVHVGARVGRHVAGW